MGSPFYMDNTLHLNNTDYIRNNLYFDDTLYPVIDRLKPYGTAQNVYVFDNNGGRSEFEAYPYALDKCGQYLTDTGFAENFLQCMDDRFQGAKRGDGNGYRMLTPLQCSPYQQQHQSLKEAVDAYCNVPGKEYSSLESYNSCVDKVKSWTENGCGYDLGSMAGPVTNFGVPAVQDSWLNY